MGLLIPLNQNAEKGVTLLAGKTEPDYPGETGLLEDYVWNPGDSLEHTIVLPSTEILVSGNSDDPIKTRPVRTHVL